MPLSLITTVCHNMMFTPCAILSNLKDSVNIIDVGEDRSFVTEEGYLSDHPALFVEISF